MKILDYNTSLRPNITEFFQKFTHFHFTKIREQQAINCHGDANSKKV